jgi:hypothetical protein
VLHADEPFDPVEARTRWLVWALRNMGGNARVVEEAARVAVHAAEAGVGDEAAAALARMTRHRPSRTEMRALEDELARVRKMRAGLLLLRPEQVRSVGELDQLRASYARLESLLAGAWACRDRPETSLVERARARSWSAVPALLGLSVLGILAAAWLHDGWSAPALLPLAWLSLLTATLIPTGSRWADLPAHVAPALIAVLALIAASGHQTAAFTMTFAGLGAGYVWYVVGGRRRRAAWIPAALLAMAGLGVNELLGLGQGGASCTLVALAAVWLVAARRLRPERRTVRWVVAAQLLACALIAPVDPVLHSVVLLVAAVLAVVLALQDDQPSWLILSGFLVAVACYWLAQGPAAGIGLGPTRALTQLWPLVGAMIAVALFVRWSAGADWACPIQASIALLVVAILALDVGLRAGPWLGVLVVSLAIVLGTKGRIEQSWTMSAAALITAPIGLVTLLGLSPDHVWLVPVSLDLLVLLVYAVRLTDVEGSTWRQLHERGAMVMAGAIAAGTLLLQPLWTMRPWGALIGLATVAVLPLLLVLAARRPNRRFLLYPAALALSVASFWMAHLLGATNPEWFVLGPGIVLTTLALKAPDDPGLPDHPPGACVVCAGLGSGLLLATTALLALLDPTPLYALILLGEACICVLLGLRLHHPALLTVGAAGALVAGFRALVILCAMPPPAAVLLLVALVGLGLLTVIALTDPGLRRQPHP